MNENIYKIIREESQKKESLEYIDNPLFTYIDFLEQVANDTEEIYQGIWKEIINKYIKNPKNSRCNFISIRISENFPFTKEECNSFTNLRLRDKYLELFKYTELHTKLHTYQTIKYIKGTDNKKPFILLNILELHRKLEEDGFFQCRPYDTEYNISTKQINKYLTKSQLYTKTRKK